MREMLEDIRDGFATVVGTVVVVGGLMLLMMGAVGSVVAVIDRYQCIGRAQIMSVNYQWGVLTGCMVEIKPNKWIPLSVLKINHIMIN